MLKSSLTLSLKLGTTTTVGNCKTTFVAIPQGILFLKAILALTLTFLFPGGDSGIMDSRAQRYCGKYFDVSEGSTRNGQVTCKFFLD